MRHSFSAESSLKLMDSKVTRLMPPKSYPRQIFFTLFLTVVLFQSLIILSRRKEFSSCNTVPIETRIERQVVHKMIHLETSTRETKTKEAKICEEVNVAMVIWNTNEARNASDCLKTLFHHQIHPVHLHLIVNKLTRKILQTLLNTWETVRVRVTFYETDRSQTDFIYWQTQRFAILKYLPTSVDKVIFIDNTIRLLDDVVSLTTSASRLRSIISIAVDQNCPVELSWSVIETTNKDNVKASELSCELPSIIYFNVDEVSENAATSDFLYSLRSDLKPEELLAKVSKHVHLFSTIPCNWYLPLRTKVDFNSCLGGAKVKGVNWLKYGTDFANNAFIEHLKESVRSITLSPPILNQVLKCSNVMPEVKNDYNYFETYSKDYCAFFKYVLQFKRRTHLFFWGDTSQFDNGNNSSATSPYEVTLLVQTSLDRFQVLQRVLKNWNGPAVVVLHVSDEEAANIPKLFTLSKTLQNKKRVTYHLVYKKRGYNAINYLRNVALNNTVTRYAFTLDVDLIPNPGLYDSIKKNLQSHELRKVKELLVVPAFEAFADPGKNMPTNKEKLLPMLASGSIVGYGMKRKWNLGHKPTNYTRWIRATKPYWVKYQDYFEPYVIVQTALAPKYHENLLERMGDKIAYARLLYAQGYEFRVLNEDFIIHIPHAISPDKEREEMDGYFGKCTERFIAENKRQLLKSYKNRTF